MRIGNLLLTSALFAGMIFIGTGVSQQRPAVPEQRQAHGGPVVSERGITTESRAVSLREVGREVARGVIEVSPEAIQGRRLMLPPANQMLGTICICIGRWTPGGGCSGIYIGPPTA